MILTTAICFLNQATSLDISPSYSTLKDLCAEITRAGVPVVTDDQTGPLQYGVCLSNASALDVLNVLKGDEALRVEKQGSQWIVKRSQTMDAVYQAERVRYVTKLRSSIEGLYLSADKVLQELYAIADRDHRQLAEFDMIKSLKAPLTPVQQLLFDSQRYDVFPKYALIRFPMLAVQQLGSNGYALSQPQTLWQTWKYLAPGTSTPQRGEYPFYDGPEEGGFYGSIFGGRNEAYDVKSTRLKSLRMAVVTDWDPQDLRASSELLIETPMQTMAGKRYEGLYLISMLRAGIADNFSQSSLKREEILDPSHVRILGEGFKVVEGLVPKWKRGKVLASDAALLGAAETGADVVFPVSSFANVALEPVEGETLVQMLMRSIALKEFTADAAYNSRIRLGVDRFDRSWNPPLLPRWVSWNSGKVFGFAPDLRCFEPMSSGSLLDVGLANSRLRGREISVLELLNAVGKLNVSSRKPSNEQLSWCNPIEALPFARLAITSPAFREMVVNSSSSNQKRGLMPEEVPVLVKALSEINAKQGENTVCGQFGAGRLLNEDLKSFVLSVSKKGNQSEVKITFDGELMWNATLRLPRDAGV